MQLLHSCSFCTTVNQLTSEELIYNDPSRCQKEPALLLWDIPQNWTKDMYNFTATGHIKIIKIVCNSSTGVMPILCSHLFDSLGQCLPLSSFLHTLSPEHVPWCQIKGMLYGLFFLLIPPRHPRHALSEGNAVHRLNTVPSQEPSFSHKPIMSIIIVCLPLVDCAFK